MSVRGVWRTRAHGGGSVDSRSDGAERLLLQDGEAMTAARELDPAQQTGNDPAEYHDSPHWRDPERRSGPKLIRIRQGHSRA
jgi:hypothetical protein